MKVRYLVITLILVSFIFGKSQAKKPNVIYILTDQWRSTALGYEGNNIVKTPYLDKFSKEAVNFKNTVSVCPVCTPYRASLLTGRFPTSTGMFMNDLYLPSEELCMAEIFKDAGYKTAYYGKWHLDGHGRSNNVEPERRQGFDYWKVLECSHDYNNMAYYENEDPEIKLWEQYSPFAIVDDAKQYLDGMVKDENPFLLFISLATPHFPHHTALEDYKQLYPPSDLELRKNADEDKFPDVRKELQGYYAHCTATDKAIGNLIQKIKDLGIYDNSIIIFTSDHGEMMSSHGVRPKEKQVAFDESVKVPFLIRYPNIGNSAGKQTYTPINTPDILPSMLSLADIDIPDCIEGEDISSVVKNPTKQKDRAVLFMSVCPFAGTHFDEYRGVKTKQHTFVKSPDKALMLFDNIADPFQLNNLVGKPEHKKLQNKMDKILAKKLKGIGDEDFKHKQYYVDKFGLNVKKGFTIPYRSIEGKENKVYSPRKIQ
jgi:arylsulfatase A-like enzyme